MRVHNQHKIPRPSGVIKHGCKIPYENAVYSLNGNISRKIMELNGGSSSSHVRLPESTLREFSGKAPASGGAKTTEKAFHSNTKQWKNMRTEVLVAFW